MSHEAYPEPSDVSSALTNAGEIPGSVDVAGALAATIGDWEAGTRWKPFLADGDMARYFDAPHDGRLLLTGYASLTSVSIGVTYDESTGAPSDGTALVQNVGYIPIYWDGADDTSPVMGIDFRCLHLPCWRHRHRSVKIVGAPGYSSVLPDNVWTAIIEGAAYRCVTSTSAARDGGISRVVVGERQVQFKTDVLEGWGRSFRETMKLYKRGGVA